MPSERDRLRVRVLLLALVLGAALAGCLGRGDLVIAASSPAESGGMTIFAVRQEGVGDKPSRQAEYEIRYQGRVVYPPGGQGGIFILEDGQGSQFVPYHFFVEGNGLYEVRVRLDGEEARATTRVDKWVEYVYLHPYWRGSQAVVDLQLSKTTGGLPTDRVIAKGDLLLEVRYRGLDGRLNTYAGHIRDETPQDQTFTRIEVPRSVFSKGPGWYSFDSTFHNMQAKGNTNVGNDPTLAMRNPPWNWIYVKP